MKLKIVVATNNAHKVDELRSLFADASLDVELLTLADVGVSIAPEETGSTFQENAYIKAIAAFEATGMPVLADDSGLEVELLDNAPGVHSARYAGVDATDADNRQHLVAQLKASGADQSPAAFRCVLCFIDPLRSVFGQGACHGIISTTERGDAGFGYDPLFSANGQSQSFAELTAEQKHAVSHRGAAVRDLVRYLGPLLSDSGHASEPDPLPQLDAILMASVAAATDNMPRLRMAINLFVRSSDDAVVLYEALLQSYLFAGFPVALEALAVLDEEVRRILPDHSWQPAQAFDPDGFRKRGEELCARIYEGVYEKMIARLTTITPDLSDWMIIEGYGKTLSRPGLDVVSRELCNVVILAAMLRRNQLVSHVRGALNVGASERDLEHCCDAVTEWGSMQSGTLLREVIAMFSDRIESLDR